MRLETGGPRAVCLLAGLLLEAGDPRGVCFWAGWRPQDCLSAGGPRAVCLSAGDPKGGLWAGLRLDTPGVFVGLL